MNRSKQVNRYGKSPKKRKSRITKREVKELESVDISSYIDEAITETAKKLNISEDELRKIVGEEKRVPKISIRKKAIKIRLPKYDGNRLEWRKAIHRELIKASDNIDIREQDRIELIVTLYFDSSAIHWHDVDNRLKDIMDALQGRLGGPKSITPRRAILLNDNQVYRVIIEKVIAPKQSLGRGHLLIKKYVRRIPQKAL